MKNARLLGNHPLLAYTVRMAVEARGIDRVVVSTEDEGIAAIALEYGADVPFMRPVEMAQDHSNLGDALEYTHHRLKHEGQLSGRYILMTLMPTSPFRNRFEIESLVAKAKEGYHINTVGCVWHSCDTLFRMNGENRLYPLLSDCATPRMFYRLNGYCLSTYWGSPDLLPKYLHEVKNPVSLIDIDHWEDFFLAEQVLEQGLFDFGMDFT